MSWEPTHIATRKDNGETTRVKYNEKTKQYEINWMVGIIEEHWDIKPIEKFGEVRQ